MARTGNATSKAGLVHRLIWAGDDGMHAAPKQLGAARPPAALEAPTAKRAKIDDAGDAADAYDAAPPPAMDKLHAPVQLGWGREEWCAWEAGLQHPKHTSREVSHFCSLVRNS